MILVQVYAALYPSGINWGINHLGYLHRGWSILIIGFMIALLFNPIQTSLLNLVSWGAAYFRAKNSISRIMFFITGIAICITVFWVGRERTLFLGDGALVSRSLPQMESITEIAESNFHNEPLSAMVLFYTRRILTKMDLSNDPLAAFRSVSIGFGLISICLCWLIAGVIHRNNIDRILICCFLLVGGASQFFFGYVEDYSLLYVILLLYMFVSLKYLEGKLSLTYAGVAFAFLFLAQFGTIILLPTILFLFYHSFHHKRIYQIVQSTFLMVVITGIGLWMCGYTARGFAQYFIGAVRGSVYEQNSLVAGLGLSIFYHFLDVVNLLLLLSPFVCIVFITIPILYFDKHRLKQNEMLFLIIASLCCLGFIAGINSQLGMSRDWDLFASFGISLCVATVYLWYRLVDDQQTRRRLLMLVIGITFLHSIPWIVVNANVDSSLERFTALPDKRVWHKDALIHSYDEIGSWYHDKGEHKKAIENFNKFIALDSTNPRILVNIGTEYGNTGDTATMVSYLEKSVEHGSIDDRVYLDLDIYYQRKNNIVRAIQYLEKGVKEDSGSTLLQNKLGLAIIKKNRGFSEALAHFLIAIKNDSMYAEAYRNAALCYVGLNDSTNVVYYLDKYLQYNPSDQRMLKLQADYKTRHD
ncbi:MAG: hypothetical protein ACHQQQ_14885 [Bacteroidota bacterium]